MRATAIVGFSAAVLAIAALFWRGELFARQPLLIAAQALAFALMVWARVTFGRRSFHAGAVPTDGELVSTGPYRYWRHPIYAAIIYFVVATALDHRHLTTLALALVVIIGLALRMRAEEHFLRSRYSGYRQYAARTSRIIPGLL